MNPFRNFNYLSYINMNKDLKHLNSKQALIHFKKFGIKEKRKFNSILENFDYIFYISFYKDLNKLDFLEACNHYIEHGRREGREARAGNLYNNNKIIRVYNKINILIRNTYRPNYFKKCIDSILNQDYENYKVIISYDDDDCLEYLEQYKNNPKIEIFKVTEVDKSQKVFYNLYCNQLLDKVQDGWVMFLDDDDIISPNKYTFHNINNNLNNENNMLFWKVKFPNHLIYPNNINKIEEGKFSGIGFCFNSKFKQLARWNGKRCGDYNFIKELLENKKDFNRIFINKVLTGVQHTDKMGLSGKREVKV